jgi:hypothetical protein
LFINKSTPKHPWITEEELNLIVDSSKTDGGTVSNVKGSVVSILQHIKAWGC